MTGPRRRAPRASAFSVASCVYLAAVGRNHPVRGQGNRDSRKHGTSAVHYLVGSLSANLEGCDLVAFESEDMFQAEGAVREITGHPSDDDRLPVPLKGTEWLDRVVILQA